MSLLAAESSTTPLQQSDYDNVDVRKIYDTLGLDYETYIREDAGRNRCVTWVLSSLSKEGLTRARCIDLGCASGVPVSAALAEAGHDVLGVDLSEGQIQLARERVPKAKFVAADMRKWEPAGDGVDALTAFYCLPHLSREDCEVMIERIGMWLKEDGIMALGMVRGVGGKVKWMGFEVCATSIEREDMRILLERSGMEVLEDWEEEWRSSTMEEVRGKINQFYLVRKKGRTGD